MMTLRWDDVDIDDDIEMRWCSCDDDIEMKWC